MEVKMNWHENGSSATSSKAFEGGYAIKLNFGQRTNDDIPGKIYLCLPDAEKSFVAGTFTAHIREKKPAASADETK
jgi:hypothetical protein